VFLKDVARVSYAPQERIELVRLNGRETVGLYIFKESKENTVKVAQQAGDEIARMQPELATLDFKLVYSQAAFIEAAIGEVKTTAIIGIVLAVLVLYAFLRNFGATIVVSLAIPISVLATFTLMYFQNLTLNVMTLGGLALGAGMLVDNAIVVIENIFRRRQLGEGAADAATKGASEVGVAITASTLTTIVVFLPIVYVRGVAAELFREQAWVVAFSLLSSLLVAFLLIPTLSARLFGKASATFSARTLHWRLFERILNWSMTNQLKVVALAAILLVASVALLPVVGTEFVPRSSENQLQIELDLPPGTPLAKTSSVVANVEDQIEQLLGKRVSTIFSTINVQSSQNLFFSETQRSEHLAELTLNLSAGADGVMPGEAIQILRPQLILPGLEIRYRVRESSLQQSIGGEAAPIAVEIRGSELEMLEQLSQQLAEQLKSIPTLHTVETSFEKGLPEIRLQIDRQLAANFGFDVQQMGQVVGQRLSGEVATNFYSAGNDRDVRVMFSRMTLTELENLPLQTPNGALVRLSDIAELVAAEGPQTILRHNQSRVAHVRAHLQKGTKLSDAIHDVEYALSSFVTPAGYQLSFAGEEASRQESFTQMKFALVLSIVLVYMVLASLFESLLHPFTILLTLPLAGVGVVFAFLLVGEPLSVMAYIGIIMLAGIAVNNAIVLVDYINRLRTDGRPRREAILQASRDRLRPILMTTATTILALLPLTIGIGEGAKLRAPMAIAVIGGLVSSTILTLVVIPVVYELIDGIKKKR
ncbi:MAG TPA: efflux RND transporter permease subunit, partial [bacterium]